MLFRPSGSMSCPCHPSPCAVPSVPARMDVEVVSRDAPQLADAEQAKKLKSFLNGDPTFFPDVHPAKRWRSQVLLTAPGQHKAEIARMDVEVVSGDAHQLADAEQAKKLQSLYKREPATNLRSERSSRSK